MTSGVLDTTGIDGIWDQILDKVGENRESVVEFACAPKNYWMMDTAIADGFIGEMCTSRLATGTNPIGCHTRGSMEPV